MKISNLIYVLILAIPSALGIKAGVFHSDSDNINKTVKLEWQAIQDIEKLSSEKFTLVDVYTDWCKVCQVMDAKTMADEAISSYLVENYNLVKFNAEEKETLNFKGRSYKYKASGKRGYNALAAELCKGKLAYPSFVVLDKDLEVVDVLRGFKNVEKFRSDLDKVILAASHTEFAKD